MNQIQRWKFYCLKKPGATCYGQHTTEVDGEWVQWKDVNNDYATALRVLAEYVDDEGADSCTISDCIVWCRKQQKRAGRIKRDSA